MLHYNFCSPQCTIVCRLYRAKKEQYWTDRLMQCGSSLPLIWRSLSSMFGRQRDVTGCTSHNADHFATFFAKKIDEIRNDTAGLPPPPPVISQAPSSLTSFRQYTEAEVRRIVMKSPIKSCSLDPVPTFLLHEFIDLLLPYGMSREWSMRLWLKVGCHFHSVMRPVRAPGL